MRLPLPLLVLAVFTACIAPALAQPDLTADHLEGTQPLEMTEPLDVVMVRGINYFAERELADSPNRRPAKWNRDYSSVEAYEASVEPNRQRLREIIGAVDERVDSTLMYNDFVGPHLDDDQVYSRSFSAQVLDGVSVQGRWTSKIDHDIDDDVHKSTAVAILIPDAGQLPEDLIGLTGELPPEHQIALRLADHDIDCFTVTPISRDDTFSGHGDIRYTNLPHREFVYRMAFEMGRHVLGYEVQKVLALVDMISNQDLMPERLSALGVVESRRIMVVGIGEGGLIAMLAAAIDPRIHICAVSGYFAEREHVWQEPIYRNIWGQLNEFGDADVASLIAPRRLLIEAAPVDEVQGPPAARDGRSSVAAPGRIVTPAIERARNEYERAADHFGRLQADIRIDLVESDDAYPMGDTAFNKLLEGSGIEVHPARDVQADRDTGAVNANMDEMHAAFVSRRQESQVRELVDYTQKLLHRSDKVRDKRWANVDRSSVEACVESLKPYRDDVYDNLIGRLPEPEMPLNPRTRKVLDEETHVGYEVVLDCYPAGDVERPIPEGANPAIPDTGSVDSVGWAVGEDWGVIAGGILLLPKDLKEGEQRPVVVCQHGLEGTPMDTIVTDPAALGFPPYKGFSTQLVQRGFIVYVPQNPYRGHDAFRVIQRKSNPMGRSLFSYIIPQHQRTLAWLASLPYVDPQRMAFYGLSYGGKTAVRVPPMLVPSDDQPGYCLSICSADFNEWVRKNTSSEDRYSYVYTGEYEIFEWNMGHVANYAELSYLMTPRPFMVERGHDDGVAPDEWVAWEFAKVKRHYDRLGIGDQTEMEVFNGPHTINGVGTFDFLHRHLDWRPESVFQPL